MTTYIRYSQVRPGDRVKLEQGFVWRDRRVAERYDAPFLEVASIETIPGARGQGVEIVTTDGQRFDKPKTSKALVLCAYCAPDERCADHAA